MAIGIVQPPTPACHLIPAMLRIMKMIKPLRLVSAPHLRIRSFGSVVYPYERRVINSVKAAEQSSGIVDNVLEDQGRPLAENERVSEIKFDLNQSLQGINRGIFGVTSGKKSEIEGLVKLLESQNPTSDPTENLDKRVDIEFKDSTITPDQLKNVFEKNYDLLLSIFNPNCWLEISYVDETIRIGRDDKGNIFILERLGQNT